MRSNQLVSPKIDSYFSWPSTLCPMDLGDDYIPYHGAKFVFKKLLKIPPTVLCHLVLEWASKIGMETSIDLEKLSITLEKLRRSNSNRRVLASKILLEYWPNGLCLYQLAQVDCCLLVYRSNQYSWTASTAWNADHEKQVLHIDFDRFTENLKNDLKKFYLCNVHTFIHPELPLTIFRVQLFDRNASEFEVNGLEQSDNSPQSSKLSSRAPYYVAFPMNSPNIIHSPDTDSYAQLILQSIERTVSLVIPVVLEPSGTRPVKSLESMQILFGVSRFSNCLGSWSSYGATSFEISPLGKIDEHQSLIGKRLLVDSNMDDECLSDDDLPEVKRLRLDKCMMRFKGSKYDSRKLYQSETTRNRIRTSNVEPVSKTEEQLSTISRYTSLIAVEKVEFTLRKEFKPGKQVSLKLKLIGNDVFGGMHELCDKGNVDIDKIPGWLTGENGADSGEIINGILIKDRKGGLI